MIDKTNTSLSIVRVLGIFLSFSFVLASMGACSQENVAAENEGYVEINGKKKRLLPLDEQQWKNLPEGYWDSTPTFGQTLPDSVDHSAFQTPIRNQGDELTCVDYAVVAGMEAFAYFQPMDSDLSETHLSTLHTSKTLQATLQAAESSKLTTESYWPVGATSGSPGWQTHASAGVTEWKAIRNPKSIEGLRARLAEGDKINVLMSLSFVRNSWKNSGKVEVVGNSIGRWAHAVLLVGYRRMLDQNNQNKWFFLFKNSWGSDWAGDQRGYGWLSEDYINKFALQAAVIRAVTKKSSKCTPKQTQKCVGDNLHHFDSCGQKGDLIQRCTNGCKGGQCKGQSCQSNHTKHCNKGHLYHYDSCGNQGTLAEACQNGCSADRCVTCQYVQTICKNNAIFDIDSCGKETFKKACPEGCNGNQCKTCNRAGTICKNSALYDTDTCGKTNYKETCKYGCNGNQCKKCTPQSSKRCENGNLYYFDSCGNKGALFQQCASRSCQDANTCTPQTCTPNQSRCANGTYYSCNSSGTSEASSRCPSGSCQSPTTCTQQTCSPNKVRCTNGILFICNSSGTGESTNTCKSGSCKDSASCLPQSCTPNKSRCANGTLYTCNVNGTGETSKRCSSGVCKDSLGCAPQTCSPQQVRCNNGTLFTCNSSGTSETSSPCPTRLCQSATSCKPKVCTPNMTSCSNGIEYKCDSSGSSTTSTPCPSGQCQGSYCKPQSCTPNRSRCSGGTLYTCNSSGTSESSSPCSSGICRDSSSCRPQICTPNKSRCSGGTLYTCNSSGTSESSSPCSTGQCKDLQTCSTASCKQGERKRCWIECGQRFTSGCFRGDNPLRILGIQTCSNGQWSSCVVRDSCSKYAGTCSGSTTKATSYTCLDGSIMNGSYGCNGPLGVNCKSRYYSGYGPDDCKNLCTGSGDACSQEGKQRPCSVHCDTPNGAIKQGTQQCQRKCSALVWSVCFTKDACAPN